MAISSNPDQLEVKGELSTSSMTGNLDHLDDMLMYAFNRSRTGSGVGDLRDFAGLGRPVVNSSLTKSNVTKNSVDLSFTVSNYGGFNPCRISARYAPSGSTNYSYTEFAQVSSDGSYTKTLGSLSSSTQYDIWVYVWNKFNDNVHPSNWGEFSNTTNVTITTEDDLQPPTSPNMDRTWWNSNDTHGTDFLYNGDTPHPDQYYAEFMLVTSSQQYTESPSAISTTNWSNNTTEKEAIWDLNNLFPSNDEWMYVRLQAQNASGTSDWSQWVPAGHLVPQGVSISEGSGRVITASWSDPNNPPSSVDPTPTSLDYYGASKTLSDNLYPVIQWYTNGSWTGDINLATDINSTDRDYNGDGDTAQARVTYKTEEGYTSDWRYSGTIVFAEPYNLGFSYDGSSLYATWSNESINTDIEYQDRNDGGTGSFGSWGVTSTLPDNTTQNYMGGNIPSGYSFQFRVRYVGASTWQTSGTYTV